MVHDLGGQHPVRQWGEAGSCQRGGQPPRWVKGPERGKGGHPRGAGWLRGVPGVQAWSLGRWSLREALHVAVLEAGELLLQAGDALALLRHQCPQRSHLLQHLLQTAPHGIA